MPLPADALDPRPLERLGRRQPGTDVSILACAELMSYMLSSIAGGYIAKQLGFATLFGIASGLALLSWLAASLLLKRYRKALA